MHLRDVLKVVGESELSKFPWGNNVVNIVNSFVPEQHQLSLESNGVDLDRAIGEIGEVEREMVLSAKVRMDGFVAPSVNSANDDVQIEKNKNTTKSIAVFMIVGSLCFIALIMTMGTTYRHTQGEPMDSSWMQPVIDAIIAVLQSL